MASVMTSERRAENAVVDMIAAGKLAPGRRLVLRKLASDLGLSVMPVSQGLRNLASKGIVERLSGGGARVSQWTVQHIVDSYLLRCGNEGTAARLCAERATPQEVEHLQQRLDELEEAVASGNEWAGYDAAFHETVIEYSHSPVIATACGNARLVHDLIARVFRMNTAPALHELSGLHVPIYDAIARRDPDAAESEMRAHITEGLKFCLKRYDDILRRRKGGGAARLRNDE